MPRVFVYIDGLNLYNDLNRRLNGRGKWLDLEALADRVAGERVEMIRYFTSWVAVLAGDEGPRNRQRIYRKAIEQLPRVEPVFGSMLKEKKWRLRVRRYPFLPRNVRVWNIKEKGSDVNLASYLLLDAFQNRFDVAYVVANDSDYFHPIRMVSRDLGRDVRIVYPAESPAQDLLKVGVPTDRLRKTTILEAQLPDSVQTSKKGFVTRPPSWPR
jgi:hypothetical protein